MNKTFHTGSNFKECAVVCHNDNFTLNVVTNLKVCIECIPRMGIKLFKTKSDTFLFVVEINDNDIEFLVELDNFAGMAYAAPRQVGDVNKSVNTAKVDKYAVAGDVLDGTFEYLTFFELRDNYFLLSFEFGFDEGFVRNDDVTEFFVDFDNLEFHGFVNVVVVVADGFDVNL